MSDGPDVGDLTRELVSHAHEGSYYLSICFGLGMYASRHFVLYGGTVSFSRVSFLSWNVTMFAGQCGTGGITGFVDGKASELQTKYLQK